jgi:hypothetical protein
VVVATVVEQQPMVDVLIADPAADIVKLFLVEFHSLLPVAAVVKVVGRVEQAASAAVQLGRLEFLAVGLEALDKLNQERAQRPL